jgi:signal recognition particle receptor subunit beta
MSENIETFQHMMDNLKSLNLNLEDIPYVMQYNKRDTEDAAPVEYLEYVLNNRELHVPCFEAVANKCEGVFETLNMITKMLIHKYLNK